MSFGFRKTSLRALMAALVLAALAGGIPSQARADAGQLCRAASNMVLAPADMILGPAIAGKDEYYGLTEIDDPMALKVVGAVPGYILLLGLQTGGSIIREISAVMEMPLGVVTLFREGEQPPLFRSQQDAWALYSDDFGPCPVRFGTSYNTINEN
jgi:hypothetical protein